MAHHKYRGIAQLVEQRSPKPRAVSSNLTAPAREKPVTTSVAGFCFFRNFEKKSDLCTFCAPFNFKSYFKVIWSPINKRLDVDIYGYVTVKSGIIESRGPETANQE